jgi:predicted HicB family RNase H-like nuclease
MMKHRGYTGLLEIDEESGMLYGNVIGLRDMITFQGETVAEATRSFHESVDCYMDLCASRNEPPEKPFSGKFLVRIPSDLHRTLVEEAHARNVSLNALVEMALAEAFPVRAFEPEPEPEPPAKADRPEAGKSKGRAAPRTARPS